MLGNQQVRFGGGQTKKEQQCHLVGWLPTFDNIDQSALLKKLQTYPHMRQAIKAWLTSGVMTEGVFTPTESGIPQGGVISPLLMNIALHGLEEALKGVKRTARDKPHMVRYADDLVIFHSTLETVLEVQKRVNDWLQGMGLELKPSKTKSLTRLPRMKEMWASISWASPSGNIR